MHEDARANGPKELCNWAKVDWDHARCAVKNLRQRIFRATAEGDLKKVRSLQKLMLRSYSNTLVSVKRVVREMHEPCAVKAARTVLRGVGGREITRLPDILAK